MRRAPVLAMMTWLALSGCDDGGPTEPQDFVVEGRVALASLVALSDGHLQQVADHFQVLARTEEARSADWQRIDAELTAVQQVKVAGLYW